MPRKTDYSVTRVPTNDWDNLMETVTLDGSYSEEIKNEVWTALEHMQDYSNPWIVVEIANGKLTANIYSNEKSARRRVARVNNPSPNAQILCVEGKYRI